MLRFLPIKENPLVTKRRKEKYASYTFERKMK